MKTWKPRGLFRKGSPLAGGIPKSNIFESCFKPGLLTVDQLLSESTRRNQAVMASCSTSGDLDVDKAVLRETEEEVRLGWAVGPIDLPASDCVVSKRFALVQRNKTRMIDDFSISGINDTAATENKVDLHMVDTFGAVIRAFFSCCSEFGNPSELVGKTYDLKSAYRQVPIMAEHLKFSYFCIYNWLLHKPEVYQLLTLPFGATHSVYSFLRLSRLLYTICTRGLYLVTTNFYDDFILASRPTCVESAKNSMELVFLLTGWEFARTGNKATDFDVVCRALGVEFDLTKSGERVLAIRNTEQRVADLVLMINSCLEKGSIGKQECLVLRGKLGFADSFLHGRIGALLLKQLSEHAFAKTGTLSTELTTSLQLMRARLVAGKPRLVTSGTLKQWFVFTDASFQQGDCTGGIGAVLFDHFGQCAGWFGFALDGELCKVLGSDNKETTIYELELVATIFA